MPEHGRGIKNGNSPPTMLAPTREQQASLQVVERELAAAQVAFDALADEIAAGEASWSAAFVSSQPIHWAPVESLAAHFPLDAAADERVANNAPRIDGNLSFDVGSIDRAARFDGQTLVDAADVGNFGFFDKFTLSAWIYPERDRGAILARMTDTATSEGYSVELAGGKLQLNLSKRWLDDSLRVETRTPVALNRWQHVTLTYDGTRGPSGIRIYFDGQPQEMVTLLGRA